VSFLDKRYREAIYNIYGFVRFADEIVDTFHDYDKIRLMKKFREDTVEAIELGISLNPVLNSFQKTVHDFEIEWELIDTFLKSMEMDLEKHNYTNEEFDKYILGSAEVVGLMCLRVFTKREKSTYEELKPFAMKLGAAFQKVNFLRDAQADFEILGRAYFPGVDLKKFSDEDKKTIEKEIAEDFHYALKGIKMLPTGARGGVYLAYVYYMNLFIKIKNTPAHRVMKQRIRVPNSVKFGLLFNSLLRHRLNIL
jgi:phytoene/squalene synthetase